MDGCTKGPQLEEEENLNTGAQTRRTPSGGTSAPAGQVQGGPSLKFMKENIDVLRTMIKELDNQGQEKITPLFNEESGGAGSENSQMSPSAEETGGYSSDGSSRSRSRVRSEARSISKPKSIKSKPQSARVSRRKSSSDSGYDTVSDNARNWFDSLDPNSVDGFEELSNKFLEEFSQQKRYDKDPTEIHGIKRKPNEGLQAFMDRFKAESAHIKGVSPVLRISAFMHGHDHPKLAKKLNDKILKIVDEMWERVRTFIRGEMAADTTEAIRSLREGFTPLTKTLKEILAMDNVNFPPPPLLMGTTEKRNMNKLCDYHQDQGHNTNDCYHLKKQIEEAVASGRLAHLVKDIRKGGQKNKGSTKGKENVINMVRSQGYRKSPYERVEHQMDNAIAFLSVPRYQLMDCPVVFDALVEGFRVRRIHVDGGSSSEVMYEHCFRNLSYRTRPRLKESRIPLMGFSG
ncbi:reverse transcriptase domain-containing protein [Tanacetum coccineum]